MSREVVLDMWCSSIPDSMFNDWVTRKLIKKSAHYIAGASKEHAGKFADVFQDPGMGWKLAYNQKEKKWFRDHKWQLVCRQYCVSSETMAILQQETNKWYKEVFGYVEKWLKKHKFIDLKKGSFDGGFCATSTEDDTTEKWGAPLAGRRNKVVQIKKKFGRVTVYFGRLTPKERTKVNRFQKHLCAKYDCIACFC